MKKLALVLAGLMGLVACEGPHQQAGERQDQAAANAAGVDYSGSGPAERAGKAQDRAEAAARAERDAAADALEAQARNYQRQADVEAQKLREQARNVREKAN
jgi:hypothetical protein